MVELKQKEIAQQLMTSGHLACPGCAAPLAMRWALDILGNRTVVSLPASCFSIISGTFPYSALSVNLVHTAFETAAALATGLKAGLEMTGRGDAPVMAWAGDGGTFDIGLQALSGAMERGEDILFVCYDNEAYMNTGNQRSSATPRLSFTTTTPRGEAGEKKDILAIVAAHKIPYAASASVAFPEDFKAKVKKAKDIRGTKFIHILSSCPTGWQMASDLTITAARLAVTSSVFPLMEIFDGERTVLNFLPDPRVSVKRYLEMQGRFSRLSPEEIDDVERRIDIRWKRLVERAESVFIYK